MSGTWKKAISYWEKNSQRNQQNSRLQNLKSLFESAEKGDEEIIKEILEKGVNINTKLSSETILHVAAFNGHVNLVDFLCKKGSKINIKNSEHLTPLLISVSKNHLEVVKVLLKHGADPKGSFKMALDLGSKNIAQILIKYGTLHDICLSTCPDSDFLNEFFTTLLSTNVDLESRIAENICNFHWEKGLTPLHLAADRGKEDIVKQLINLGADVNAKSEKKLIPLDLAVRNNKLKIVEILLNNGADVNYITNADVGLLFLSEKGSFIKNRDSDSQEEFEVLVRITEILLRKKVSVNCLDKEGFTPLHHAASINVFRPEIVRLLLDFGADVNAVNKSQATPIFYTKNETILEILIERGANVNFVSRILFTPLSHMFNLGQSSCVEILLKNGADLNIRNSEEKTILEIYKPCHFYEDLQMLEILINSMTDLNPVIRRLGGFSQSVKIDTLAALIARRKVTEEIEVDLESLGPNDPHSRYQYFCSRITMCESEIDRMKSTNVNIQNLSYFDIFSMPISRLLNYAEKEEFLELESDNVKENFPIYADMLQKHIEKARIRRSLIDSNAIAFQKLIFDLYEITLPDLVVYKIIPLLNTKQLNILAQVLFV